MRCRSRARRPPRFVLQEQGDPTAQLLPGWSCDAGSSIIKMAPRAVGENRVTAEVNVNEQMRVYVA
jgi:hypothetical protein